MYTDESEEESEEVDVYRKKYQLIVERCEVIQQDNERLVNRIHQVKKILKRRRKERKFLMDRLDMHGDNWRNVPLPLILEDLSSEQYPSNKFGGKKGTLNSGTSGSSGISNPSTKRKATKVDKNAPKRPANPFFQFCQEQRNSAIEEMATIGHNDLTKIEVTKHLANKWNMLPIDDKKIYYDKYEKSKERYNADMQMYAMTK
uniref:HMG box domain-containing protein n=1 Tax=Rhodnius prolixus TaxID=13249 RepID=T1IES5_RHOPR